MQQIKEILLTPLSINQFNINEKSEGLRIFFDDGSIKVHYLFDGDSPDGYRKLGIASVEELARKKNPPEEIGSFIVNGTNFAAFDLGWSKTLDIKLHELIVKELRNLRRRLDL